jgi:hypothetical protein
MRAIITMNADPTLVGVSRCKTPPACIWPCNTLVSVQLPADRGINMESLHQAGAACQYKDKPLA